MNLEFAIMNPLCQKELLEYFVCHDYFLTLASPFPPAYLVRSSKLGRSSAHAASAPSKCKIPHRRHPPSGFAGCTPENGVSPAQPGGPETTCHAQQK